MRVHRLRGLLLLLSGVIFVAGLGFLSAQTPAQAPQAPPVVAEPFVHVAAEAPAPADDAAPPPPAAPEPDLAPEPPQPAAPTLGERIDALLDAPDLGSAAIGIAVTDELGRHVVARGAERALLPASTQKLLVAAGALAVLGPEYRYTTQLLATAAPDASGTLTGDLVLAGGGDPALASPVFARDVMPLRPHTPLAALADQAVAAGVRHITGGVLGDPRVFAHEPTAPGWRSRYVERLDATLSSGLTVDGGRKLSVRAGKLHGEASPDPAAEAAATLLTLLRERGVQVDGGVAATHTPPAAPVALGSVASPPLRELLRWTVQRSDNHMADAIFRTLGAAAGTPTWAGSATALRGALAPAGLDWTGVRIADGSGLSRDNRLSPALLTALDLAMARSTASGDWNDYLAVAGQSGTLRRRLVGTLAEGRLRGKTGSLRDVRSLSGVVSGPGGRRYHFAVIGNDVGEAARAGMRRLQDELVLALAEDLHACERVPLPVPEGGAAPEPAYELACAA